MRPAIRERKMPAPTASAPPDRGGGWSVACRRPGADGAAAAGESTIARVSCAAGIVATAGRGRVITRRLGDLFAVGDLEGDRGRRALGLRADAPISPGGGRLLDGGDLVEHEGAASPRPPPQPLEARHAGAARD